MGALEHLLHQAGPWNKHVVHFAIQAMSQACQGVQRDTPVRLGLLQFAGPLSGHAQTLSQRFGTHAQRQSDRLCPTAPGRCIALQLREIAKLTVEFSQTGEIQAVFQGTNDLRQQAGSTLEALWQEWRAVCPEGIGYSQFTESFRRWPKQQHIVFRKIHIPGEKLFVDFAGTTVTVRSRDGGPSVEAQIFVAVLGYSNYTFMYAVPSQTTAHWLECHDACFANLGGVPKWVVTDNLKAAVIRREGGQVVLNPAYRGCLTHFGTAALPTGARKPKEKSKAEVGVQIVQRLVLFRIRDFAFFSVAELNAELTRRTKLVNARLFKKMSGSRLQRFVEKEHAALQPLPEAPFEMSDWRYGVRVGDDYHVEHERSFYSTPCELRGERVDLRITASTVEIMSRGRRVALHLLADSEGSVVTIPEHRPVAHTRVLEGEPKALTLWAASVGPSTQKMIQHHLQDRTDLTNGLRAARRMRDMARLHGDARFEEVCAYALPLNITALRSVESILKKSPDKGSHKVAPVAVRPSHDNLRGAGYFGGAA